MGPMVITSYTYDQYDNKTSELLPGNASPSTYIFADANNPRLMTARWIRWATVRNIPITAVDRF
jgi:hypothetical protein